MGTDKQDSHRTGDHEQAERQAQRLGDSARQVWLAGVGAFARAQAEGSKLFDSLVRDGLDAERSAGTATDGMRGSIERGFDDARARATDTWSRLEQAFDERIQRSLTRLGVPGRDDLADLGRRIDTLTAELRKARAADSPTSATSPPRKTTARTATKPVPHKPPDA